MGKIDFSDCKRVFIVNKDTWYVNSLEKDTANDIIVQLLTEEGSTKGEFVFSFDHIGIRLKAYNDAWAALAAQPELIALLSDLNNADINADDFAEKLREIGYEDITEREYISRN